MGGTTTFSTDKRSLLEILKDIKETKTQLPDFQRSWIWDQERIRNLIASVSLSYPIGAIMMLETGNTEVNFKPRPIDGVETTPSSKPENLILDGQQRLTALFQSLFSAKPVKTKSEQKPKIELKRWYYLDIAEALNKNVDREDAIVILHEDRALRDFRGEIKRDYSSPDKEYNEGLFPLSQIFHSSDWRRGYNAYWNHDGAKVKFFEDFESEVIKRFEQYLVPQIIIKKETPKDAICQVFERVNTGGVSLNVFELLTATFASDNFNLREDWSNRETRLRKKVLSNIDSVMDDIETTDFLQVVSLLVSREKREIALGAGTAREAAPGISCKRKDILRLSLEDYRKWADIAEDGFRRATSFLLSQYIFSSRDLPYGKQIVPLAAIFSSLGGKSDSDGVQSKVARWYWCGVLGEFYGGAIESIFAKDLPETIDWVNGGPEPTTIVDSTFSPRRLLTMRTRNSAAYKGLYALLMKNGCLDFGTGKTIDMQRYFAEDIDIHHVFPSSWCERNSKDKNLYDSIVNKTGISASTNRSIGGNAPSAYLEKLQKSSEIDTLRMNEILASHLIEQEALRKDDFESFFRHRAESLIRLVEDATGKQIAREDLSRIIETES